jgi:PPOX class probable FMN-dependent enzyme
MGEIDSAGQLRTLYPAPKERTLRKVLPRLDAHCINFIGLSPFCVLSTVDAEGCPDLSPRGGDPGFVKVLDAGTLLLQDRPGNNRLDSLSNIAERGAVALLFFIPGVDELLRVYGRAAILPAGAFEVEPGAGRPPTTALRIDVERAFFHCAKALMRSHLWSDEARVERSCLPTLGEILHDQLGEISPLESQEEMIRRYLPDL